MIIVGKKKKYWMKMVMNTYSNFLIIINIKINIKINNK